MLRRHVLIAYLDAEFRRMLAGVFGLEGYSVAGTDSAAAVYDLLRTSQEPQIVLLGPWLVGGTGSDVLRLAAEDAALSRHEYIALDSVFPLRGVTSEEFDALSRRLRLKYLPLPFMFYTLIDVIDAPGQTQQHEGEAHS